jgi:aerobic carbon-monoxide dehydrogenase medium subunit
MVLSRTVNAPCEAMFKALVMPAPSLRFVDGVNDLKEIDSTHYEAKFETRVGYMKFKFAVTVEVTRVEQPSEIEARIEGAPLGVVGRLTARTITKLTDAGSETKVSYAVETTLAGKLGSIGSPCCGRKPRTWRRNSPRDSVQHSRRHRAPFELGEPTCLTAAAHLLDRDDPSVRPIAGGTALMLTMKAGVYRPQKLISLRQVEPIYANISVDADGLCIGAMTTLGQLERSHDVQKHVLLISRTLVTLSNVRVRNVATVGGALANGDPHMDLPPVLMALGATLTTVSPDGERQLAVEDLFSGYYETVLGKNELIAEVRIPVQRSKKCWYSKVTSGSADDWPALGVAAVIDAFGDDIRSVRLVASAATDRTRRLRSAETVLSAKIVNDRLLGLAAEAALADCELIADVRGSVAYTRALMRVYLRRTILSALRQSTAHS